MNRKDRKFFDEALAEVFTNRKIIESHWPIFQMPFSIKASIVCLLALFIRLE